MGLGTQVPASLFCRLSARNYVRHMVRKTDTFFVHNKDDDGRGVDGALGPVDLLKKPPVKKLSDPQRLVILKQKLEEAEAVLGADYQMSLFSGGALGQNAMRESDVIRIPWQEVRYVLCFPNPDTVLSLSW